MNNFGSSGDEGRRPEGYGHSDRTRYNSGHFGGYGGAYGGGYGGRYDGGQHGGYSGGVGHLGGYGGGQYGGYSGSGGQLGSYGGGQYGGYGGGRSYNGYGSGQYGPSSISQFGPSGSGAYGRGGYGGYYDGDRFQRGNDFYQRTAYPSGGDRHPRDQYRGEVRRGSISDGQFDRERRDAFGGRRDLDRRDDRYGQDHFGSSRRPGDESYPREALYRTDAKSNRPLERFSQSRSPSRTNFRCSVDPESRRSETPGAGPVVRIAVEEPRPN